MWQWWPREQAAGPGEKLASADGLRCVLRVRGKREFAADTNNFVPQYCILILVLYVLR